MTLTIDIRRPLLETHRRPGLRGAFFGRRVPIFQIYISYLIFNEERVMCRIVKFTLAIIFASHSLINQSELDSGAHRLMSHKTLLIRFL